MKPTYSIIEPGRRVAPYVYKGERHLADCQRDGRIWTVTLRKARNKTGTVRVFTATAAMERTLAFLQRADVSRFRAA